VSSSAALPSQHQPSFPLPKVLQRLHFSAARLQAILRLYIVCTAHVHLVHFRSTHALIDAHFVDPRVDLRCTAPAARTPPFLSRCALHLFKRSSQNAVPSTLHSTHIVLFAPVRRSSETNLRVLRYFHTTQVLYPHVCTTNKLVMVCV